MKKVLFVDRDGTILVEPPVTQQIDKLELVEFLPGAIGALSAIARTTDYELVMVTNQDGLGTESFPEETFWPAHNLMLKILEGEGVRFSEILIDRSFAHESKPTRKPGLGLLGDYLRGDFDLAGSFVIGDRSTDLQLAENLGARGIILSAEPMAGAALSTTSWDSIRDFVCGAERCHTIERRTKETSISISLSLYGTGRVSVSTGLGFFDHMLDLLLTHAGVDAVIAAKGDLHVDEHHLVEDVGIALGEAIRGALGDKRGISRYGFLLPMDESSATVAIDLSGRNAFQWEAEFKREKIGDVPTEMFPHFFKSLADAMRCALHVKVIGENEHHKSEAAFKGVGRVLRQAFARDSRQTTIPSTKGVL